MRTISLGLAVSALLITVASLRGYGDVWLLIGTLTALIASLFVGGRKRGLGLAMRPQPAKSRRPSVAEAVLAGAVADRPNWTLPRLADEIEKRSGVRISHSRLSVVLRQRGRSAGAGRATP